MEITTGAPCHCFQYAECWVWDSWNSIPEAHAHSVLPRPSFRLDSQTGVHSPPFQLWNEAVPLTLLERSPRILPSIGLCLGMPKASMAIALPTLLLTPAHCNTHRWKRAAKLHLAVPSPSGGQGQDRRARALNEVGWSCLSWRPVPVPDSYFPQSPPGPTGKTQIGWVVCKGVRKGAGSQGAHRGW